MPLSHGSLLLMPAETGDYVGVKIASVAPGLRELAKRETGTGI